MNPSFGPNDDSAALTRRGLLGAAAVGAVGLNASLALGEGTAPLPALAGQLSRLQYLTPPEQFRTLNREKPRMDQLSPEKLREVGLDRDTWKLEVIPDPASDCKVERPLTKEAGTALDWAGLMKLAETRAVRFMMVLTCTNVGDPFGMGLWEGVPLREVIWMARPTANVRRAYYYGYHNDDPKQIFQSSLPIGRVLEDPPGELPVILCYKLNGRWLEIRNGGPVRLIVPGAYGNKSVKFLQKVVLTNSYQANDTYALWNNDVESPMKTHARFINPPKSAKAGQPLPIVGLAEAGMSGLSKVQYALHPKDEPLSKADPYLTNLDWKDATILPPPKDWGGGLPEGKLPPIPLQFDEAGRPRSWPLRYTLAHWAAVLTNLTPGAYHLRCRTIDGNGVAQPMPRPFLKSGHNPIQQVDLTIEP